MSRRHRNDCCDVVCSLGNLKLDQMTCDAQRSTFKTDRGIKVEIKLHRKYHNNAQSS